MQQLRIYKEDMDQNILFKKVNLGLTLQSEPCISWYLLLTELQT